MVPTQLKRPTHRPGDSLPRECNARQGREASDVPLISTRTRCEVTPRRGLGIP